MKNMTITKRRFELKRLRERYRYSTKLEKINILDEFCKNFGYDRKYAINLLQPRRLDINKSMGCKKRGPKPKYQPDKIVPILKEIWFASDQACSKKLAALIPYWLPHYEAVYGAVEPDIRSKLLTISSPTIDRILAATKFQFKTKGKCGTKPGTLLKKQIPIHNNYWNEGEPGFLEADTVAHCGDSIAGDFVWSLTMTDIYSPWTELRATWGKGETGVIDKIKCIEVHLPFKLKGFDSDNGSEFLNHSLLRYFTDRKDKVAFTRSRPYRKNDNAHVEQKNWSCVRQLLGYDRIDDIKAVEIINDIYINEWSSLNNFFMPTMKLEKKSRDGSQIKKIHSKPITPYERLLASKHLNELQKQLLKNKYATLNPFELRSSMERKLTELFKLVKINAEIKKRGNI